MTCDANGVIQSLMGKMITGYEDGTIGFQRRSQILFIWFRNVNRILFLLNTGIDGDSTTIMHHYAIRIDITNSRYYLYVDGIIVNSGGTAFTGTFGIPPKVFISVAGLVRRQMAGFLC